MNFILRVLEEDYNTVLISMSIIAVVVFIALFFIKAGYGIFRTKQWGCQSTTNWLGADGAPCFYINAPFLYQLGKGNLNPTHNILLAV